MRIGKTDLDWAASQGVITTAQADALWRALDERTADAPKFDLVHVAYYGGALLVIAAMGWFLTDVWESLHGAGIFLIALTYAALFLCLGVWAWGRKTLRTPGGLLVTMAVCMTPLAVYGLQRWTGVWPFDDPGSYVDFHRWIRGGWFAMEMATLATGLAALRHIRFPFLTAPIAFVLWYVSMDLTPIIAGGADIDWVLRRKVSMWFGLGMLAATYVIDRRTREDFAFWGYLFGLFAFWGGLTLQHSDSELAKFIYFLINLALMLTSVFLRRRAFLVFGAMGAFGYFYHLAETVFRNSFAFTIVLTALGLSIILAGVQLRRHGPRIEAAVVAAMPAWAMRLRPGERNTA